jgi:hypothetical protein
VDRGAAAPAAPDPLVDVFFPPPLASLPVQPAASSASAKPPLLRQPAGDPGAKPPLLRQPAADPNTQPFKFTDVGPNAPQKGMPLQAGVEYNRINLGLDAQMQQYDAVNNVARYNALQLQSLEVQIESTMTRVGGQIFDTGDIKRLLPPQGAAKLGSADGVEFPVPDHWRDLAIMWVCRCPPGGDSATFYSSVCQLTQVHHSSFGDGVIAAGEWIVRKGKLWKMSANSGHYRPTIDALYRAVLHLACARQADSTLFLYDTKLKTWADVNWGDFIAKPTGGGRYTTHPDSPVPS